ncbi:MAG TPA: hypothetical protein VK171_05275 [Fimbriimonas sp.]|nr:hypothetical protein [Fimbriimonas sp.]
MGSKIECSINATDGCSHLPEYQAEEHRPLSPGVILVGKHSCSVIELVCHRLGGYSGIRVLDGQEVAVGQFWEYSYRVATEAEAVA